MVQWNFNMHWRKDHVLIKQMRVVCAWELWVETVSEKAQEEEEGLQCCQASQIMDLLPLIHFSGVVAEVGWILFWINVKI